MDQVRSVYEDEDGKTKVTEDVLIPDRKSIFPLQAALSYNTSQVLYQGLYPLLVENKTTYTYIKAINSMLAKLGRETLNEDLIVIPCKNTNNIVSYARLFVDLENYPVVLLDSDSSAQKAYNKLTKSLFLNRKKSVLRIGEIINDKQNSEIEDLIGKELLVKCLNNKRLASPLVSVSDIEKDKTFIDALREYCKENNIKLSNQWRYKLSLSLKKYFTIKDSNYLSNKVPTKKIEQFEKLIKTINYQTNK